VSTQTERGSGPRVPLSRERVLQAAVKIADDGGIESLTMRRLADEVGAEAMSLYYHVARKEDVLDGIVEVVAQEINEAVAKIGTPSAGAAWKQAMRQRILVARQVFLRHRWAPALFETRATVSLPMLRYYDALLGLMRDGGFPTTWPTMHCTPSAAGRWASARNRSTLVTGLAASRTQPPWSR
jgi:AcrR family transcriptional regulator